MTEVKRVRDIKGSNGEGSLLRMETYPGTGSKKWATVLWDGTMSPRRVDPASLEVMRG